MCFVDNEIWRTVYSNIHGVSRNSISIRMVELINNSPLKAVTDIIKADLIGKSIMIYPSVQSTMDIAREQARCGAAEGCVIIAEQQVSGRGRLERRWISPPGNIAMSVILRPEKSYLSRLTMVASLAVVGMISELTNLNATIKWPNDVQIKGKKICGILTESEVKGNKILFAIVGIGLNVNMDIGGHPEIADFATSLYKETDRKFNLTEVLAILIEKLDKLYGEVKRGHDILPSWREHLDTLGKGVNVIWGNSIEAGIAESVNNEGNLIVRRPDGVVITVVAGDVSIRTVV